MTASARCAEVSHIDKVKPDSANGRPEAKPSAVIKPNFFIPLTVGQIVDIVGLAERAIDDAALVSRHHARQTGALPLQPCGDGDRAGGKAQLRLKLNLPRIDIEQGFVDRHGLPLLATGTVDGEMPRGAGNAQLCTGALAAGEEFRVIIRIHTG